ncbi:unnamed protein product, partial [marine sediment metagenome]
VATGFSEATTYIGIKHGTYDLASGRKQAWEFMIDPVHKSWHSSASAAGDAADYSNPDTLDFLMGTVDFEKAWEQGLIAHWKMDEQTTDSAGSGDSIRDHSGTGLTGAVSASDSVPWAVGKWGGDDGALDVDTDEKVTVADNDYLDNLYAMTFMAWIRPDAQISASSVILGKHDGSNGYQLKGGTSGVVSLKLNANTTSGTVGTGTGQWYHVAATFTKKTKQVKTYVNGQIDNITTNAGLNMTVNASDLVIGDQFDGR